MLPLKEKLASRFDARVLEFDGHGSKSAIGHSFSVSSFVIQLDTFIETLEGPVHVFGYSMGGFIALISAARGNQSIKSITTLGTKLLWDREIASKEVKNLNPETIKEKVPGFFESLERRHGGHWVDVLSRTSNFMQSLGSQNPIKKELMNDISCRVQLLVGEKDQMVSQSETSEVAGWIPGAKFEVLKGAEHPIERLDVTTLSEKIASFI